MSAQYTGGYSVHLGDIMSTPEVFSTVGRYHEYIGGIPCSVWGISLVQRGVFSTLLGYHEYRGDTMMSVG